jgi:NitT/TauT family transport system substrate-binding protein
MSAARGIVFALAAVCSLASLLGTAQAEPLRLFHFTWVGYGPLFVAQEKGFFAREGIEVSLIRNDEHNAAFAGLADGQVDAVAGSLQDIVLFAEPGEEPLQCVLVLDDSRGADGIAANKDIRSIAALKGKRVAVALDSSMQFYLNLLLREAGLSEADLGEVVDLWGDEAAEAFLLREVDAAVTWEPDLTPAKNAPHGHLLFDTSERPGLVVDCLLTTADILSDHQAAFRALGRAWDAAVDFIDAHPDEGNRIIARYFSGALDDPAVVGASLRGVHLYDGEENRAYFGAPDRPGQIYETMQLIIDVWSSLGRLKAAIAPADAISHDVLEK